MLRTEYSSLRQGLVGAWCPSLGASGQSLIDRSGRNAHGTLSNYKWAASEAGLSIDLGYMVAAPSPAFGAAASLTMWVRLNQATPSSQFASGLFHADNLTSGFTNSAYPWTDGKAYMGAFRTTRLDNISLSPLVDRTRWHMVSVVTDGSLWRMWQNDILVASFAAQASVAFNPLTFNVGRNVGSNGPYSLNGQWDDFRLYSRALTPAEIRLLASRRGIGLSPLPDRGAALPRRFSVNVGGTWREADSYVNVGGVWRLGQPSVNVGGTWK